MSEEHDTNLDREILDRIGSSDNQCIDDAFLSDARDIFLRCFESEEAALAAILRNDDTAYEILQAGKAHMQVLMIEAKEGRQ
jgi:hypothetical protein